MHSQNAIRNVKTFGNISYLYNYHSKTMDFFSYREWVTMSYATQMQKIGDM